MDTVRASIEVDAPIEACYEAWRNLENFPEFMGHVKDVRVLSERESAWVVRILGVRREWRANMVEDQPPTLLAWEAVGEVGMDGQVTFRRLASDRTRVDVAFTWRGGTLVDDIGQALNLDEAALKQDLEDFRDFVEGRKAPRAGAPAMR